MYVRVQACMRVHFLRQYADGRTAVGVPARAYVCVCVWVCCVVVSHRAGVVHRAATSPVHLRVCTVAWISAQRAGDALTHIM